MFCCIAGLFGAFNNEDTKVQTLGANNRKSRPGKVHNVIDECLTLLARAVVSQLHVSVKCHKPQLSMNFAQNNCKCESVKNLSTCNDTHHKGFTRVHRNIL